MGSTSSKENEAGHSPDLDDNERVRQHIRRIDSAGLMIKPRNINPSAMATTPTYPGGPGSGAIIGSSIHNPSASTSSMMIVEGEAMMMMMDVDQEEEGAGADAVGQEDPDSTVDFQKKKPSQERSSGGGRVQKKRTDIGSRKPGEAIVPMVFKWEHGGRQVYLSGTFNGWQKPIPMHRSGNDFTYIVNLSRGKHAYKYIVDEEWRFAPDQPTVADVEGNINNFVDVTDFVPLRDFDARKVAAGQRQDLDDGYGRFMPDIDDYTKEPPPLPPHLRHIILNKVRRRKLEQ